MPPRRGGIPLYAQILAKNRSKPARPAVVQLVDAGVYEDLGKDMANLVLHDGVDIFGVQLRVAGEDVHRPLGVLLQGLAVLSGGDAGRQQVGFHVEVISAFRRLGRTARPMTSMRPMFSFLMWWSFAWG